MASICWTGQCFDAVEEFRIMENRMREGSLDEMAHIIRKIHNGFLLMVLNMHIIL